MTSTPSVAGGNSHASLPAPQQRVIWGLAWPIMLSNITVPLLGLVDTAILGHLDSVSPLAAVAIGAQIFTLLLWSFGFLRMGTTAVTAYEAGRAGLPQSVHVLYQSLWLVLPIGVVCACIASIFTPLVVPLFGADTIVHHLTREYLAIRFWGIPITLLQYCLVGWFIGRGETRIPMMMLICANLLNGLLNYYFVWHLNMGVEGVALGSLLAEGAAVGIAVWAASKRGLSLRIPRPVSDLLRRMIVINRDLFIRTLTLLLVFALFAALGAAQSTETLAANAVLISLLLLISNALDAFAHAAESLIGRYTGAEVPDYVRRIIGLTGLNSLIAALLLSVGFILLGETLFHLLTDNPAVLPRLKEMQVWLWLLPLSGFASYWLDGVMVGAQATASMRNAMLGAAVLIFLPLATMPWWWTTSIDSNTLLWTAFHCFLVARAAFLLPALLRIIATQSQAKSG